MEISVFCDVAPSQRTAEFILIAVKTPNRTTILKHTTPMMEEINTSETSVNFSQTTLRKKARKSYLHFSTSGKIRSNFVQVLQFLTALHVN